MLGAAAATATLAPAAQAAPAAQPLQIPDPPPGKALIVFYRKWEYPAMVLSYTVREGRAELGVLGAGTYFVAVVDPGLHTYSMHAERRSEMQIEVEAGETYYVRFELDSGWLLYQPTLTPSEQRLFDPISSRLTLSKPLPTDGAKSVPPTPP